MKKLRNILHNEKAAIDLASIMVGIIVIGLIGGVISATVFAVIPWAQDEAAKSSLKSVQMAQNVYAGLAADGEANPSLSLLAAGTVAKTASDVPVQYASSIDQLEETKLLSDVDPNKLAVATGETDKCYVAMARSDSGKLFWASESNTPSEYKPADSSDCVSLTAVAAELAPAADAGSIEAPAEAVTISWDGDSASSVTNCEISGGYCINGTEPEWAAYRDDITLNGAPQSWAEGVQNETLSVELRTTGQYSAAGWYKFTEADGSTLTNAEIAAAYPGVDDYDISMDIGRRVDSGELQMVNHRYSPENPLAIASDSWTFNTDGTSLSMRPPIAVIEQRVHTAVIEQTEDYVWVSVTNGNAYDTVPAEVVVVNNSTGESQVFPVEISLTWPS